MIRLISFLLIILVVNGQSNCIFNQNNCTCSLQPAGNICLRYSSGPLGSETCESYSCNEGYVCDCSGNDFCDIIDCSASHDVYRPNSGNEPTGYNQFVGCQKATQVNCVQLRLPSPSPSDSPSSSPSQSPTPSKTSSSTPTSSSTSTPSPTPSPSTSMSPSPSMSVSLSPSPSSTASSTPSSSVTPSITSSPSSSSSPAFAALGATCDSNTVCPPGASCNCINKCARNINIDITGYGHKNLEFWLCNNRIGGPTADQYELLSTTYTGQCSDIFFKVRDESNITAVVASILNNGDGLRYSTSLDGSPLVGTVVFAGGVNNFDLMLNPNYPFTEFSPVINSTLMHNDATWKSFIDTNGGGIWTYRDDQIPGFTAYLGQVWYRVILPFCYV